jgi:uncharacterized protein
MGGLIRLLTWLALGYFLWYLVRNYQRKQDSLRNQRKQAPPQTPSLIVKCTQCGLHLPQSEAVSADTEWFCGDEHRLVWLARRQH